MNTRFRYSLLAPVLVGALVAMGIATGMIIAPVRAQSTFASIGRVDVEEVLAAHPDLENVVTQLEQFEASKLEELAEYEDRTELTDEERTQLMEELYRIQEEVEMENQRLIEPLYLDILNAAEEVSLESGIEVILDEKAVLWGGLNLTPLIIQKLQGS